MSVEETGQETPVVANEDQTPATTPEQKVEATDTDTQAEQVETETAAEKTFTQAELDEILKKRIAKAEATAERRVIKALEKLTPQPPPKVQETVDDKPRRDQFDNEEDFIDSLTDWKLERRDTEAKKSKAEESQRSMVEKTEKLYLEAEKLPGFDRDDFDQLPLTPVLVQALIDSDQAPKLMAYMTSNPEEVERITALTPARQAAELGKLEVKLSSTPVKTTKTPAPITPVGGSGKASRDLGSLSMDDYISQRNKQSPVWKR